ncbi:MAG: chorismate mutase [Thermomicrobiales bacterium]
MTAQEALAATSPKPIVARGIRGATTAAANTAEDILETTQEMVTVLIALNGIESDDIVSAIFTTTPDLTAMFPALAARTFGWTEVPMMCSHEMNVPGALEKAVRVLVTVNTTKTPKEVRHVYLKGAKQLRPEWGISDEELAALRSGGDVEVSSASDLDDVPVTTSAGISS